MGFELRVMREETGLSVTALAGLIGVSPSTLRRYEKDDVNPPSDVMDKVKNVHKVITADAVARAGERIKFYRESLGLSCAEFAKEVGLNRSNCYEIENGTQELTERTAKKIEDRFDIGKEWLLYGLEKEKDFPVSDKLISWIKSDPQLRRELWKRMRSSK